MATTINRWLSLIGPDELLALALFVGTVLFWAGILGG